MDWVTTTDLRARFARSLSSLYGSEVPAYNTLVAVSREVNQAALERRGADAERLGSIARVTAERHGAIRVGSPKELAQVACVFGALGMEATGFYDLRDAHPRPVPVVSTAFRPVDPDELAANPFRVFTSMLVPEDRRFFTEDLKKRLVNFIGRRELFPPELLVLAERAERDQGLAQDAAKRFLTLATEAFKLSSEPVDRAWYEELERISGVAADIGGVASTHINHLTPRVLDIGDLYDRMQSRGVQMIDRIQGPPAWEGPDVLLRQTSFQALAEPRTFRESDGALKAGQLRVRFGEVEARGIALTTTGRDRYDALMSDIDRQATGQRSRDDVASDVWRKGWPSTELGFWAESLAFFTYHLSSASSGGAPPATLRDLVSGGWLEIRPVVYEDFLPRSAAGIFASNLSGNGNVDGTERGADRDISWLSGAIDRPIHVPEDLYRQESVASLEHATAALGVNLPD